MEIVATGAWVAVDEGVSAVGDTVGVGVFVVTGATVGAGVAATAGVIVGVGDTVMAGEIALNVAKIV